VSAHDPLCEAPECARCHGNFAYCPAHECICDVAKRVRADERARWSPPAPATPGHVSYCWCPTCGDPCAGLEEKR
jgi:hypothetical protein